MVECDTFADLELTSIIPCASAIIGELDEEADAALDFSTLRAEPLKPVVH